MNQSPKGVHTDTPTITVRAKLKAQIADGKGVLQLDKSDIALDGPKGLAFLDLMRLSANEFDVSFTPVAQQLGFGLSDDSEDEYAGGPLVTPEAAAEQLAIIGAKDAAEALAASRASRHEGSPECYWAAELGESGLFVCKDWSVGGASMCAHLEAATKREVMRDGSTVEVRVCPKCWRVLDEQGEHDCELVSTNGQEPTAKQRRRATEAQAAPPPPPDEPEATPARRRESPKCAECMHARTVHGRSGVCKTCGCPAFYITAIDAAEHAGLKEGHDDERIAQLEERGELVGA